MLVVITKWWRWFSIVWTMLWAALFLMATNGQPPNQDVADNFFLIILVPWTAGWILPSFARWLRRRIQS